MKLSFLTLSLLFISFICSIKVSAQEFKLAIKSVEVLDNKMVVRYDFTEYKKKQRFNIWLEIKNSSGNELIVKSTSGDLGNNLEGGKNKQIVWDFIKDNIEIDDNLNIEVKAEQLTKEQIVIAEKPKVTTSTGKALLLSAIFPGWGLSKVKRKKAYLFLGVVNYGTAAMSYIYYNNANNNYKKYLDNDDISSESDHFSKSNDQETMSKVFLYSAIGAWTANMIWTYISAAKYNKINFATNFNPYFKTTEFTLSYRF